MDKGDLKGISLFIHLVAYIVYKKNSATCKKKRSTYAHFTRLEVEYRLITQMIILIHFTDITRGKQDNKKFENKRDLRLIYHFTIFKLQSWLFSRLF